MRLSSLIAKCEDRVITNAPKAKDATRRVMGSALERLAIGLNKASGHVAHAALRTKPATPEQQG